MEMTFSTWLRETGRLYVRYMAVGAVSVPFAIAYAFAREAGWGGRALLPILSLFGLAAGHIVWQRLAIARQAPQGTESSVDPTMGWAHLIRAAQSQEYLPISSQGPVPTSASSLVYTMNWDEALLAAVKEEAAIAHSTRLEQVEELRQNADPGAERALLKSAESQGRVTSSISKSWLDGITDGMASSTPQPAAQLI